MPRWLPKVLTGIRALAKAGQVRFTLKARRELAALLLGLDEQDACDLLAALSPTDFVERIESVVTGEWLYVFKPTIAATALYLKVIVRNDCIVISFHEDEGDDDGDDS